jgi:uroporphyrinogen-III synthase
VSQPSLAGRRVGLLESRMSSELAELVRRMGGEPVCAPALREEPVMASAAVGGFLDQLVGGRFAFVVLLTGVGVNGLVAEAAALGRKPDLVEGLRRVRTVCRGPKPQAALRTLGLVPTLLAASPHTTKDVLEVMAPETVEGTQVAMLQYGERNPALTEALQGRGAQVFELLVYEWRLPEDVKPLHDLVEAIAAGNIDVVAFTSQVQARHLFQVAGPERADALRAGLNRTLVGAIGPVCAQALVELGVKVAVTPDNPKLRPFLAALAAAVSEA